MKKLLITLTTVLAVFIQSGCGYVNPYNDSSNLTVTCSIFPQYDIARRIGGDKINLNLLLKAGADSHNYEQTAADIVTLSESDIFIAVGGVNDIWTEKVLPSFSAENNIKVIKLMECVREREEETSEGIAADGEETDSHEHETEYDEHVWTNPNNMILAAESICEAFIELDKENETFYRDNCNSFIEELILLDADIRTLVSNSARKTIIFGDRFAFRYFAKEYGLNYYAAFSGCSSDTDADAQTLAYLIDKVKGENIPVVYYLENGTKKIADAVCRETDAEALLLHSCHTVSADDFKSGVGYIDLMRQNLINLEKGLM